MIVALTGATGFVGRRTLARALAAGHRVRALARRPQPPQDRVDWVPGALDDQAALAALVAGAEAVIHIAGVVNADRAGFVAGNVEGTRAIAAAASEARVARFVHVSSLAAREPTLSTYGWSKAEAETIVAESGLAWNMVRPPAVYGPGDTELRDVFRLARLGLALLPPPGRMSAIYVDDLAALLVALAATPAAHAVYEVEGPDGATTHAGFAHAIGAAVGRRVLPLPLPRALLSLAARIDGAIRGGRAKLTADRVSYLSHPDWTADPAKAPPASLWTPATPLDRGLAATAAWYRANGLL